MCIQKSTYTNIKVLDCVYIFREADIDAKDASGFTPMMNAIAHGHKEVVRVFLDKDNAIGTEVKQGMMLLEWAIESGHVSLIKVFISITVFTCYVREFAWTLTNNYSANRTKPIADG